MYIPGGQVSQSSLAFVLAASTRIDLRSPAEQLLRHGGDVGPESEVFSIVRSISCGLSLAAKGLACAENLPLARGPTPDEAFSAKSGSA